MDRAGDANRRREQLERLRGLSAWNAELRRIVEALPPSASAPPPAPPPDPHELIVHRLGRVAAVARSRRPRGYLLPYRIGELLGAIAALAVPLALILPLLRHVVDFDSPAQLYGSLALMGLGLQVAYWSLIRSPVPRPPREGDAPTPGAEARPEAEILFVRRGSAATLPPAQEDGPGKRGGDPGK